MSQESTPSYMNKTPLDPIVALGTFFSAQKQPLADHAHRHDPTIQQL